MKGLSRDEIVRILFAAAALVGVYFAAQLAIRLSNLWMLIFGSVVVAVTLRSIADPLVRRTRMPDGLAVFLAVLLIVIAIAGVSVLFGQRIGAQASQLAERLPAAWEVVLARLQASPVGDRLVDVTNALVGQAGRALLFAQRFVTGVLGGFTTLTLVAVAGVFLAIRPGQSRDGALSIVPLAARPRLREVMDACGRALQGWLRAQMVSMATVGVLTGLGLWAIGVPSAGVLGLLTGLAQFVPIVGPILSAVPGLLVAATVGGHTVLLTLALYVGVSQLEANLITPLVQKNVAALPVVLGVFAVVGLGSLFGPLGVLFATPLALVLYTAVTMLYRQDVLHDPEAHAPGQLKD
ncbi:AI-2E family transporter [Phenylobacterium deserti]|uniref:AI-2E family transporter n=1 Tax=Phenylobacterium deserti TaxID=1914756 RepID=A0A328AP40_9CAUL|nr:AI-2E family transporter [Phenylobacterium deserti]RAK56720.1 AI-2E family transporter [Phenylobacterium deserti]